MDLLAYLDPGSGSMILQILAGGIAAVAVTAKLYWNRLLKFLRIRKDDEETTTQQADSCLTGGAPHARRPQSLPCSAARLRGRSLAHVRPRPDSCPDRRRTARAGLLQGPGEPRLLLRATCARALSADGPERLPGAWRRTEFWKRFSEDGGLVGTELLEGTAGLPGGDGQGQRRRAQARAHPVRLLPVRVAVLDAQGRRAAAARPHAGRARGGHDPQGLDALQRPVQGRAARCSWTSARSSGCARASRGSATASSACSTSTRCCCSR